MLNDDFIKMLMTMFGESSRVLHEMRDGVKPSDITQSQYNILEYIYFHGNANLSGLSGCLYMSMPNASREVKKLIDKGFLMRQYDSDDRRTHLIAPTEEGTAMMEAIMAAYVEKLSKRYEGMSEQKQKEHIDLMKSLIDGLLF